MDAERYHTVVEKGPWEGTLEAELVEETDSRYTCRLNADVSVPRLTLTVEGEEGEATYRWAGQGGDLHGLEKTFTYEGETFDLDAFVAPRAWQCGLRSYVSTRSPDETVHTYKTSRRDHTRIDADLVAGPDGYRFEGKMHRTSAALGDVKSIVERETGIDIFEELPYAAGDDW